MCDIRYTNSDVASTIPDTLTLSQATRTLISFKTAMPVDIHQQLPLEHLPVDVLESILEILRRGENFNGVVFSLLRVHPEWRHSLEQSISSVRPRVLRPMPFAECLRLRARFVALHHLALPPLTDNVVDFAALTAFKYLRSLELRELRLADAVANSLTGLQNLRAVSFERSTLNSGLVKSLATLPKLRTLRMKGIEILEGVVDLGLVLPHQLVVLEIEGSPQLTEGSLMPIADCTSLKSLTLGKSKMDEADVFLLSSLSAKISLVLDERHDLDVLYPLGEIKNLRSLKVVASEKSSLPVWMKDMSLETLAIIKEVTLTRAQIKCLPVSLKSLSISVGFASDVALTHLMHFATRLTELSLYLPYFEQDIGLGACTSLKKLKIAAKELGGEALCYVSSLVNLTSLQVGTCLNMTGSHVQNLIALNKLSVLDFCGCTLMNDAYKQLSELSQVKHLSFYFCQTMNVEQLLPMPHLKSLQFGCCHKIETNLGSLLSMPFISHLNFIGFKFHREIPASLWAFCDRELAVSVNPDIALPERMF